MAISFNGVNYNPKNVLVAFVLAIIVFSAYSFYTKERLLVGALPKHEADKLVNLIESSDQLPREYGELTKVDFDGGFYDEKRDRFLYSVTLDFELASFQAELRIKKGFMGWSEAYLVSSSPKLEKPLSIKLLSIEKQSTNRVAQ